MQRILLTALAAADLLLLLLFAAGYAARYVHPQTLWWLQLVAVGLPVLSGLVVCAALGAALVKRWDLLALHVVACVLILIRFQPVLTFKKPAPHPGDDLAVMTFNVAGFSRADARSSMKSLQELLQQEQPDLIGLQEAPVRFLAELSDAVMTDRRLLRLVRAGGYTLRQAEAPYEHAVVRQPLIGKGSLAARHALLFIGSGEEEQKAITRSQFEWQGRQVAVYNVHLQSFSSRPRGAGATDWLKPAFIAEALRALREDLLERAEEVEQLRHLLDRETLPFILCGDLNSTPHHWAYGYLARGLADTFGSAGAGWGATYPARFPLVRIDYVLASPHWQVLSAQVSGSTFSDHLPLIVRLALRDE